MPDTNRLTRLLEENGIRWQADEPLSAHCTFRIGGPAKLLIRPADRAQLCKAILLCTECGERYYLLGNGSNVLFSDRGYDGAVIELTAAAEAPAVSQAHEITAGAGAPLARVCTAALDAGLTGLEFAYGIPGTVGGAVYMNAGAYGGEIRDVLRSVDVLTQGGTVETRPAEALGLSYRHSVFEESGECILSARFALAPGNPEEIRARMEELMGRRRDKQPLDKPNAGSTFKRPQGAFAGALIEQCGLRGCRVGGAAVSEKHCGFVVNLGGATCADVLALCEHVRAVVLEKTGYCLEKEIRVVE